MRFKKTQGTRSDRDVWTHLKIGNDLIEILPRIFKKLICTLNSLSRLKNYPITIRTGFPSFPHLKLTLPFLAVNPQSLPSGESDSLNRASVPIHLCSDPPWLTVAVCTHFPTDLIAYQ